MAAELTEGMCKFCNQTEMVDYQPDEYETPDEQATMECICSEGRLYRIKTSQRRKAYKAAERIIQPTGENSLAYDFVTACIDRIVDGLVEKVQMQSANVRITISENKKGWIEIRKRIIDEQAAS